MKESSQSLEVLCVEQNTFSIMIDDVILLSLFSSVYGSVL